MRKVKEAEVKLGQLQKEKERVSNYPIFSTILYL